jgi:hypothetical protein
MAYYPIINDTQLGSPPQTPRSDGYFLLSGNQTANFTGGDRFIAYDTYSVGSPAVFSSAIYVFTVAGSPSVVLDGGNTRIYVAETIPDIASSGRSWVQATDGEYVIEWSDSRKNGNTGSPVPPGPLTIQPATIDSTTDLNLPGRGVLSYGEAIDESLLHLLENFAGPVPPGAGSPSQESPVEGQLWYDTSVTAAPIIRVWNETASNWDTFQGSGKDFDDLNGDGTTVVTTVNVNVQAKSGALAFQQVFLNGVLQREDATGNYTVTGANTLTFAVTIDALDEVLVYAL